MAELPSNTRKRKAPSSLRQIGPNSPSRKHDAPKPRLHSNGTGSPLHKKSVSQQNTFSRLTGPSTSAMPALAIGILAASLIFGDVVPTLVSPSTYTLEFWGS